MRRLYFLLPDPEAARKLTECLLLARIPESKMHVIARDEQVVRDYDLPPATIFQETDVLPAVYRGVAAGGVTGVLAGVASMALPAVGLGLGMGTILLTGLAGAGFGAAVAPMLGIGLPNSELQAFQRAVEGGQLLMLVDVPKDREAEVREWVNIHCPQATVGGTEPLRPIFP